MKNMAKKNVEEVIFIRNMADGPRDYPMADRSSVYLPAKVGGPAQWREIPASQWSDALKKAEAKGLITTRRETRDAPVVEIEVKE